MPNNTTPTQKKKTDQNQPVIINPQHVLYMTWYILLFTVLIVAAFVHFYRLSEAKQVLEVVSWNNEKQQSLRSGPVWFGYDEQAELQQGMISHYDEIIQRYAKGINWDWRLVAAIIYPLVNMLVDIGYHLLDPRVGTS